VADRGEGREVSEVIAAEHGGAGGTFPDEFPQGGSLVRARWPELEHQSAGFERERGAVGEPAEWLAQQRERRGRIGRPPRMHGQRRALVLHRRARRRGQLSEQPGQRLAHGLDARGDRRLAEHARLPALRAIVPEHDEAGHVGEAAKRDRFRGWPARDDRHGAEPAGQPGQRRRGAGGGHRGGRVGDDGGEGAVVVGREQRAGRVRRERGEAGLACCGFGAGQRHRYLVPGCGERMRWRRARCARSRLTSTGSNFSASGLSISSLSNW
jgi:hypothetical protein